MKRLLLFVVLLFAALQAKATHNIAGEITARCVGPGYNVIEVTVTTYTDSRSPADRCELIVEWGDGNSNIVYRVDGPSGNCPTPATMGIVLGASYPNIQVNYYRAVHIYPGPSGATPYIIRMKDPNRVAGVENIPNSVNEPFYLQTEIFIDPNIGCNSTPSLTSLPLDVACAGSCFYHNPGAVDPDGDSLSYRVGPCLDTLGNPIPGYQLPNVAGGGNLQIDAVTGDLSWCSPQMGGKYNLVIYIDEWRRLANGNRVRIGTVLRDMSVDVFDNCLNDPPVIPNLPDYCVDANTNLSFNFNVTDPNSIDQLRLLGLGGAFNLSSNAAVLVPNGPGYSPQPIAASFTWTPTCEEVRLQPWVVTFKATDNDPQTPLTDIESVRITVVAPGPPTLTVTPQGSSMTLNWTAAPCNPTGNRRLQYKIFRRNGPSGWNPAQCETGVPAYTGFVLAGIVNDPVTTFIDNNNGNGLVPGLDYCYRVCAVYLDGAESYASPEACSELLRDVPVITHVDITSTSVTTGTLDLRWVNAIPDGVNFDTLANPGPYSLTIQRSAGFSLSNPSVVTVITVPFFTQLPTLYSDAGLNTSGTAYTYRIDFAASTGAIGNSQQASSVFAAAAGADNQVQLSWNEVVPWTNIRYDIFRFNTVSSTWDSVGYAFARNFTDTGLINGTQYCYYVRAVGTYNNAALPSPLYNQSQEVCAVPVDSTPPCPPGLTIVSDCVAGNNQLIWTNPMNISGCNTDDVVLYHVWFTPQQGQPFQIVATITNANDTQLLFQDLSSVAGCYAITAADTLGNESSFSNIFCLDNCPVYELPNVFTPDADNVNDLFVPFPYRHIESIDIKIYDRWGALVFETTDPAVRWDGFGMTSNRLCTDGVYYYVCTVNEIHVSGIKQRELKGFVHLFGKPSARPQ
ncbi:MAG: gliding motility-associated C-terminal domain-containing protein [Bacteroidia bacterium]|jgi:gliding motility-associated-like protein|nr:gliding motility-associated C-terminal domain-containing protein [Bacteroidia bacterium]